MGGTKDSKEGLRNVNSFKIDIDTLIYEGATGKQQVEILNMSI